MRVTTSKSKNAESFYITKGYINAILSDLIYARILEPASKRSTFRVASEFLEKPSYALHDIYRSGAFTRRGEEKFAKAISPLPS